ncbi:phosphatase PAP2 family protein [uncultured Sphingomonas sp.]|uniref:acid phosphatase n=1 Tax=uncultured Sphingomonas sp. TaxID=158754 RepID=UPI0035CB26D3
MRRTALAAGLSVIVVGALAGVLVTEAFAQEHASPSGYLATGAFDVRQVLPPAPVPGDPRADADRAEFRALRKLEGTPRWAMATNDVKLSPADLGRDFSCSLGVALTPQDAPRTVALLRRAGIDTGRQTNAVKNFYRRPRPYHFDPGPVCEPVAELADSFDYPSGHTTLGWTWATILARLAPDRATAILARGRAFGESRAVCGAHNLSAVENGFLSASATLDAVAQAPAFQADLADAQREIDALRADPATPRPDAKACATEAALVAQRIY